MARSTSTTLREEGRQVGVIRPKALLEDRQRPAIKRLGLA